MAFSLRSAAMTMVAELSNKLCSNTLYYKLWSGLGCARSARDGLLR